jgi:hypothetical protein
VPQADVKAECREMVDAIWAMRIVQRFDDVQFDQKRLPDRPVHETPTDRRAA